MDIVDILAGARNGTADETDAPRKPRIALMGEFSAGKSTLSNLLLGARPLPEKVTATRLSPVWIAKGTAPAYRETLSGARVPVSLDDLASVPVEDTRVIRIFLNSDILDVCDLIDCPGISDPNMPPEVWQRMLSEVDAVIWCTHATQAWRQSEAAAWEMIPAEVRANSTLLITRFDKLLTEKDRARVLARVRHETEDKFAAIFPISLLRALEAGEDHQKWVESGADAFAIHLIETIDTLGQGGAAPRAKMRPVDPAQAPAPLGAERPRPVAPASESGAAEVGRVVPRRVRPQRTGNGDRPQSYDRPAARQMSLTPETASDMADANSLRARMMLDDATELPEPDHRRVILS